MATVGLVSLCFLASFAETDLAKGKHEDSSEATLSGTLTADKSDFLNDSPDGKESFETTLSVGLPAYQTATTTAVSNATVVSVKNLSSNLTLALSAAGKGNGTVLAIGLTYANSPSSRPKNQSNIHLPLGLALTNVGSKGTIQKSTPNAHSKKSPLPKETSKKRHKGSTREWRNGRTSSTTECKLFTSLFLLLFIALIDDVFSFLPSATDNVLLLGILVLVFIIILVICLYCFWPSNTPTNKVTVPQGSVSSSSKISLPNPTQEKPVEKLKANKVSLAKQMQVKVAAGTAPYLGTRPSAHNPTTEPTTIRSMTTAEESTLDGPTKVQEEPFTVKVEPPSYKKASSGFTEAALPRDDQSLVSGTYQTCLTEANPHLLETEKANQTVVSKEIQPSVLETMSTVSAKSVKPEVVPEPMIGSELPAFKISHSQDEAYRTCLSQANPGLLTSPKKQEAPSQAVPPKTVSLVGNHFEMKSLKMANSGGKSVASPLLGMPRYMKSTIGEAISKPKSGFFENTPKEILPWTSKDKPARDEMSTKEQVASLSNEAKVPLLAMPTLKGGITTGGGKFTAAKHVSPTQSGISHYKSLISMTLKSEVKVQPKMQATSAIPENPVKSGLEELKFSSALALETVKDQVSTLSVNSSVSALKGKSSH